MLALSIRQPWAWLILHGGKDIENRTWRTSYTGRIYVHASAGMTRHEYESAVEFVKGLNTGLWVPARDQLERGGIVGTVLITGCTSVKRTPWFFGPYGFELADPRPLPFRAYKGKLGFFEVQP